MEGKTGEGRVQGGCGCRDGCVGCRVCDGVQGGCGVQGVRWVQGGVGCRMGVQRVGVRVVGLVCSMCGVQGRGSESGGDRDKGPWKGLGQKRAGMGAGMGAESRTGTWAETGRGTEAG